MNAVNLLEKLGVRGDLSINDLSPDEQASVSDLLAPKKAQVVAQSVGDTRASGESPIKPNSINHLPDDESPIKPNSINHLPDEESAPAK